MRKAVAKSSVAVVSSALTTIFGFAVLALMRFKIGADLGLVLAKGVIFSLVTVVFLLPVITVFSYGLLEKTTHRPLLPPFTNLPCW